MQTIAPHAGPILRIGGNSADETCLENGTVPLPSTCTHKIYKQNIYYTKKN